MYCVAFQETEVKFRGSTNIGGESIKTRKSKPRSNEDKPRFDRKTRRPKSMDAIKDSGEIDDYSGTSTKKGRRRSSILAGQESKDGRREPNTPVSYRLENIDPPFNGVKESYSWNAGRRISKDLSQRKVSGSREVTSPFQKAVQESGILQIQDRGKMNRRQSREEIVTDAILSQMKMKKSRDKRKSETAKEEQVISKSQTRTNRRKHRSKSSGWELDSGKMLVSSQTQDRISTRNRMENNVEPNYLDQRLLASHRSDLPVYNNSHSKQNLGHGTTNTTNHYNVKTDENLLNPPIVYSASSANGWNCLEMDSSSPAKSVSAEFFHHQGLVPQGSAIDLDLETECDGRYQTSNIKGVSYYSRHHITEPNSSVDVVKPESIIVSRYPQQTVPENRIDIIRYSPEHSPVSAGNSAFQRSPAISVNSRANINDLLSAGINANPELIHRYENSIAESASNNRVRFVWPGEASFRNRDHSTVIDRDAAYRT